MAANTVNKDEITFEVKEKIAVCNSSANMWSLMLNKISWNGREPKGLDLRWWDPKMEHCRKGITLSEEDARGLMVALQEYFA